jgi:hypothetical protein
MNANGISPSLWGDSMWVSMYSIAFGYPANPSTKAMQSAISYFKSMCELIPCESCKDEYTQLLLKHPIELSVRSGADLCKWVNRIHNEVNVKLKKPAVTLIKMRQYFSGEISDPLSSNPQSIPIRRKKCRKCEEKKR